MQITIKKIQDIKVGWRNRHYDLAKTKELAESIKEIGLLHPIIIDADNNLIAGLHRLEAVTLLGRDEIPASVIEFSVLEKEIAEIDENLIRAELTELEKADLLCRAKEIYELRHPGSKRFEKVKQNLKPFADKDTMSLSDKGNDSNGLQADAIKGFTENTAEKLNNSARSIRRLIHISKNIIPEVKDIIKNTAIADSKTELLSLAHIEPEKQMEAVGIVLKNGKTKKIKKAVYEIRKKDFNRSLARAEIATAFDNFESYNDLSVSHGDVFNLGGHILICGDNTDPAVIEYLRQFHFSFSFADPPYNLGIADYDQNEFTWNCDYLSDVADIVAVIPGIMSIQNFLKISKMPYRWALACHVKNLHSGCPIGFTHWYFTAIFSNLESINYFAKDYIEITLPPMPPEDKDIAFKRQKPAAYIVWLLDMFSKRSDLISDPFAGSGQTLMVCEALGRKCVTVEVLPEVVRAIIHRFENKFGVEAVKINTLQVKNAYCM